MSIGHLLDHACNVWRLSESRGATFGETVQQHARVYAGLPCTFQRRNTSLGQQGPGLRQVGERPVYLDVGPVFQNRDIVEVTDGPAGFVGPQLLEVESIAVPRGHHIELRATEWLGTLPVEGS